MPISRRIWQGSGKGLLGAQAWLGSAGIELVEGERSDNISPQGQTTNPVNGHDPPQRDAVGDDLDHGVEVKALAADAGAPSEISGLDAGLVFAVRGLLAPAAAIDAGFIGTEFDADIGGAHPVGVGDLVSSVEIVATDGSGQE